MDSSLTKAWKDEKAKQTKNIKNLIGHFIAFSTNVSWQKRWVIIELHENLFQNFQGVHLSQSYETISVREN